MGFRPITATPTQIMVEQLAASGVKYVFYNSGSREARFFDALHVHPEVEGILALHEGSVAAMAGGYTQVNLDPAVMVVHLGAGLAQSMGQLINVWDGGLPVVVITFAGDTGSYADRVTLDLNHSFGPTSISAPITKASWTVIEPDGLPQAIDRALRVATTPPEGPVHLAVYDRLLGRNEVTTHIIEGGVPRVRPGAPQDKDVEEIARALQEAERPLLYIGDGVWRSGADAEVAALADHFGTPMAGVTRDVSIRYRPGFCGRLTEALPAIRPDTIVCIGVRHGGQGMPQDIDAFAQLETVIAIGADSGSFRNIQGLDLTVLADERQTLQSLNALARAKYPAEGFEERRAWAHSEAGKLRDERMSRARSVQAQPSTVRPWKLMDALDDGLERIGGGLVMMEQFAVPLEGVAGSSENGNNVYIWPAGGSEGYGVGATVGVKLAAPDRPVVGLVGDGSLYYADSGLWTSAHHRVPVLYVIPNNQAYGIVAGAFGEAGGPMSDTGEYAGVVLDGIDPVRIADGFGVDGMRVDNESRLNEAIAHGLRAVQEEHRPYLLDVRLPVGLPAGGRAAKPFRLADGPV